MASSDALWNEVARIINKEFYANGQPISGELLRQLVKAVSEVLTEDNASV